MLSRIFEELLNISISVDCQTMLLYIIIIIIIIILEPEYSNDTMFVNGIPVSAH